MDKLDFDLLKNLINDIGNVNNILVRDFKKMKIEEGFLLKLGNGEEAFFKEKKYSESEKTISWEESINHSVNVINQIIEWQKIEDNNYEPGDRTDYFSFILYKDFIYEHGLWLFWFEDAATPIKKISEQEVNQFKLFQSIFEEKNMDNTKVIDYIMKNLLKDELEKNLSKNNQNNNKLKV